MPIGTSKVGALGGLVPGGTETFNASGTFCVPPGVKAVSITGAGSPGNPGNSGTAGNPGNPGNGGGAGGGGASASASTGPVIGASPAHRIASSYSTGNVGGKAIKSGAGPLSNPTFLNNPSFLSAGGAGAPYTPANPAGPTPVINLGNPGSSGTAGSAGSGGSAGSAGNPGNTGCGSSGFGYNFTGGAGGNAGTAGNAGNSGPGGPSGVGGIRGTSGGGGTGGSGGTCGGSGAPTGAPAWAQQNPGRQYAFIAGGGGGGGAGLNGSGQSGTPTPAPPNPTTIGPLTSSARPSGGFGGQGDPYPSLPQAGWPPGAYYGIGGSGFQNNTLYRNTSPSFPVSAPVNPWLPIYPGSPGPFRNEHRGCSPAGTIANFVPGNSPNTRPNNAWYRAGGGGGAGGSVLSMFCGVPCASMSVNIWPGGHNVFNSFAGGGGGGGGRGGAGGTGGSGGAGGTGVAATPTTQNCVPVTPGCSYPIVVNTGGQVVISWNPQ